VLFVEAMSLLFDGDAEGADALLARTVEVSARNRARPGESAALAGRAALAMDAHDWDTAGRFAEQAETVVDDWSVDGYMTSTLVHAVAARVAAHRGDIVMAKECVARASRLRPLCTSATPMTAYFLLQLARACLEVADPAGGRAVLRQLRDILQACPDLGILAAEADELDRMLDTVRVQVVGASALTAAELRLLPLLATHLTYPEIGERLHVSRNTVKSQTVSLYRKLGVSSRTEAIDCAERIGLLRR
jgi:LuxR family maltose regulon positive regulatory protein